VLRRRKHGRRRIEHRRRKHGRRRVEHRRRKHFDDLSSGAGISVELPTGRPGKAARFPGRRLQCERELARVFVGRRRPAGKLYP